MDVTPILDIYAQQSRINTRQVDFVGAMHALSISPTESEHTLDILAYLSATHTLTWNQQHPFGHLASLVTSGNYLPGTPLRASLNKDDQALLPIVCKNVMGDSITINAASSANGPQAFLPTYDENERLLFYVAETGELRRLDKEAARNNGFTLQKESPNVLASMKQAAPANITQNQIKAVTTFVLGEIAPAIRLHQGKVILERVLAQLPAIPRREQDKPARTI